MIPSGESPEPAAGPAPPFEFATAARIRFGPGTVREIGSIVSAVGRRALIVTGSNPDRARPVMDSLASASVGWENFPVQGEPTTLHVASGVARARLRGLTVVIGVGGGSAIDAAKAIAGLLTNERDLFDYLEVIGRGQAMTRPAAPWIAVPTTAGSGAEVTRNAVLTSREHKVKASLRSLHLLAHAAIVDPELTLELPAAVTAATGLDALTQLIEPFVSPRANPFTDALCRDGFRRVARSLDRAFQNGQDIEARTDMAFAALCGGLSLANAGLGAVHGLAAPLGGSYTAPHGAVCAALLPGVMRMNLRALRERAPDSPALPRFERIARDLTAREDASAEDAIAWTTDLVRRLGIPSLRNYGLTPDKFGPLAEAAAASTSMKANPILLTREELVEILESAW
jgi:alcohol dehydrogenase class IV